MISLILTSCARFDLLEESLVSFFTYNTFPVSSFTVYDDYGAVNFTGKQQDRWDYLAGKFPSVTFIAGLERAGQIAAIDLLMKYVATPYYFTTEDDFIFNRQGFIEDSIAVMEEHTDIISVCVTDCNQHRKHPLEEGLRKTKSGVEFNILQNNYHGHWGGFSFCPSVRRMSDYVPYGNITKFNIHNPAKSEIDLSKYYLSKGKRTARLAQRYGKHTGGNRHVSSRHWDIKKFEQQHP